MTAGSVNGTHAVIIGAGMAGLLAAAALSDAFEEVTIIEKDSLPDSPEFRNGVAQGAHVHTLLGYGVEAMDNLIPGLMADLYSAGAVKIRRISTSGFTTQLAQHQSAMSEFSHLQLHVHCLNT